MSFHICPLNIKTQALFISNREMLLKKRIPIAVRAYKIKSQRSIVPENVRPLLIKGEKTFSLGSNHFYLLDTDNRKVAAAAISHFGSILRNAHVRIWITKEHHVYPVMTLIASRHAFRQNMPRFPMDVHPGTVDLLGLQVRTFNRELIVTNLISKQRGLGAKALAGIYNFAKDMGLNLISFNVDYWNKKAMQIYFHLDFGKWKDEQLTEWEIPL